MRFKQDLSIAIVLAVVGCGLASPTWSRDGQDQLGPIEAAMDDADFTAEEMERVRTLIAKARGLQREGDEDGAAEAMAAALRLLRAG